MKTKFEPRDVLIALIMKYHNDWNKIYDDIRNKRILSKANIFKYCKKAEKVYDVVITIIDDDYPESLKHIHHPPFGIVRKRGKHYAKLDI